jgi:hypothetical protein
VTLIAGAKGGSAALLACNQAAGGAIRGLLYGGTPGRGVVRTLHEFPRSAGRVAEPSAGAEFFGIVEIEGRTCGALHVCRIDRERRRFRAVEVGVPVRPVAEGLIAGVSATA